MSHLQNILNKAYQHFIVEQNPLSIKYEDMCSYITADGRKCAIGLYFSDEACEIFESTGDSFGSICLKERILNKLPEEDFNKIEELKQEVAVFDDIMCGLNEFQLRLHDDHVNSNGDWRGSVDNLKIFYHGLAKKYNLTMPENL